MKAKKIFLKTYRYYVGLLVCIFFASVQVGIAGCKPPVKKDNAANSSVSNENIAAGTEANPEAKIEKEKKEIKDDYRDKEETVTPEMFGAIGDGVIRKLSTKYRTLGEAKRDYPSVQDLDVTIDGAAFQKAVDVVSAKGGGTVSAEKNYAINFPIETKDNVIIDGGSTGKIYNDRSREKNILQCAFFIGDHHAVGFTPLPGSAKYKLYAVAGKITAGQNFAELVNASDASAFKVGQLIILTTVAKKKAVNDNVQLPYHITICKITNISGNKLSFEYPIDENVEDPQIAANGSFDSFSQIQLAGVQNVTIRNFTIDARSWAERWYGYKCTIENITLLDASELIIGNALAHSTIRNIKGNFSRRGIEIKTGSQDLVVDGIDAVYKGRYDPKVSRAVISIGEYNRNITIKNFKIDMGDLSIQDPVIDLHARKATIEDGEITCRNQTGVILRLFSDNFVKDAKYACYNNKISNVKFHCGNNVKNFLFIGSTDPNEIPPTSNTIENCEFDGGANTTSVLVNSGDNNVIKNNNFNKAKLVKRAASKNDKFESNTLKQ